MKDKQRSILYALVVAALVAALTLTLSFALVGCKSDEDDLGTWDYTRDPSLTDFGTQVTLETSNLDTNFEETGRGYVTVQQHIDGDTVHFNSKSGKLLKVRFQGIDTPESTGKVEPWGKPASIYTKTKLKNADKIVLESDKEGQVTFDSTGSRYLAWVWYLPKGSSTWHNLNIEILADGLAVGKSTLTTRYGEVAVAAITDARSHHLNMHSSEKEPLYFYGETVDLTIKALVTNKQAYNGIKVRFEGVVAKKSGEGVYVQAFDQDTNQYYGVYVYGGYASLAPKFLVEGYRLSIAGTADNNETFGFQVSGLSFSLISPEKDDVKILEKNVEIVTTTITADDFTNPDIEDVLVEMHDITVTSVYTTKNEESSSKGAMTLTCKTQDGKTVKVRTVVLTLDGETVTEEYFKGKTISRIKGIIEYYEGEPQLKLFTTSDVEFKQ